MFCVMVLCVWMAPLAANILVLGGLTRIEPDTMALRSYKSRKSTRFALERLLFLRLPC